MRKMTGTQKIRKTQEAPIITPHSRASVCRVFLTLCLLWHWFYLQMTGSMPRVLAAVCRRCAVRWMICRAKRGGWLAGGRGAIWICNALVPPSPGVCRRFAPACHQVFVSASATRWTRCCKSAMRSRSMHVIGRERVVYIPKNPYALALSLCQTLDNLPIRCVCPLQFKGW
jgi:hypothetical protein